MMQAARRLGIAGRGLLWFQRPAGEAIRWMGAAAVAEEAAESLAPRSSMAPTIVPSQNFYDNTVELFARKRGKRLTLQAMLEIGKVMREKNRISWRIVIVV